MHALKEYLNFLFKKKKVGKKILFRCDTTMTYVEYIDFTLPCRKYLCDDYLKKNFLLVNL